MTRSFGSGLVLISTMRSYYDLSKCSSIAGAAKEEPPGQHRASLGKQQLDLLVGQGHADAYPVARPRLDDLARPLVWGGGWRPCRWRQRKTAVVWNFFFNTCRSGSRKRLGQARFSAAANHVADAEAFDGAGCARWGPRPSRRSDRSWRLLRAEGASACAAAPFQAQIPEDG